MIQCHGDNNNTILQGTVLLSHMNAMLYEGMVNSVRG